ncbi:DNA polymerase III subunit delta' [Neobacillus sp. MM2021_6]|uniref:DNA polymerase III subunit delta' n=1 Tax=Bacillaceae TaxID=186817 RepID=UPI00140C742D|nr:MULTISPECIES: DNA polymerase III subunit delta' [Bacillaceae]MBO0961747.1 DNA polymerase III subunit delta' [Neobacillus sp. MM2021_6]NHC19879.1 DNA polymerase III subunit delta' [Bacillus sp. MM2020_4]WML41863.1 DNA polymerase III subunit delta' [Neobacillus sp. OS1-2]
MVKTWDQLEELQWTVLKMLKNSLLKNRVAHAYLFEGIRGTGKKEVSLLLTKALFCESLLAGYKPCESCTNCRRINNGNHPDVHIVEPDGLSIKVDQIRNLQAEFSKKGVESSRKVYVIVHADKMSVSASNSLLKFLEEPSPGTVAFLLTEQLQQILPTILSRCQVLAFRPLAPQVMVKQLQENGVEPAKAPLLAQLTNNLDEALKLNVDEWFAQAQKIVVKLYEVLRKNPLEAMVTLQGDWFLHFKDKEQIQRGLDLLLLIFKDLLYIQLDKQEQIVFIEERERLKQFALQTSGRRLSDQMSAILDAKRKLQANMNPQLMMEQLVLKIQEGSSFV